jgi:hypothetical protein
MASIPSPIRCARPRPATTPSGLAEQPTARQLSIARACRARLKRIFVERPGGRADDQTTGEIQELCLGALRAVDDPICGGSLVTIHACAAALYSDKAHRHWESADTSGVDRLRQRIFRALNAYERRLLHLEVGRAGYLFNSTRRPTSIQRATSSSV